MKKLVSRYAVPAAVALAPVAAFADTTTGTGTGGSSIDFSGLTNSISASTVITPIMAVAGIAATIYLAVGGAKLILAQIRRV